MATPNATATLYLEQQQIARITTSAASRLWNRMTDDFDTSFQRIEPDIEHLLTLAQTAAARSAIGYTSNVLYETGQVDLPAADLVPESFAGTASDGRTLSGLLLGAVTTAKSTGFDDAPPAAPAVRALTTRTTSAEKLAAGGRWLTMTLLTAIADANREAMQASIGMRPAVGGYVRMLNPPSCSRCIILAGKWFRWNQGFLRHPRCDCRHIPASENVAESFTTDPYEMFHSLSAEEQEKLFGRIEARAIREGADIYRVVNVGQRGLATARGAAKYGTPSRMTIDDIFKVAGTRTNAVRLMEREGYITGPQVAGGNIIGQVEGLGQFGRGGTRVAASNAVTEARLTGVRDPLNRYTMTAAERRLYDAELMMQTVRDGKNPWLRGRPLTQGDIDLATQIYLKQIADLPNQPQSVRDLARLLGIL